jgi:hypothetical protein
MLIIYKNQGRGTVDGKKNMSMKLITKSYLGFLYYLKYPN